MRLILISLFLTLSVVVSCTAQRAAPAGVTQVSLSGPDEQPRPSQSPGTILDEASQQGSSEQNQRALPLVPLIIGYEHVPHYFMQTLTDDPHYARIEAALYDAGQPVYNLVLTEKNGRRINYSNSEEKVTALKRSGAEARLARIDHRFVNKFGQLPAHEFGFTDERGQAVRWLFTLAAPASERGAGLTEQEGVSGWVLVYRDLGSVAGAGTAVQIGDRVSEAEAWEEISAPPYFVAYRGVYAEGLHLGVFPTGREAWRVTSAPEKLQEGAQWTLMDERGRQRQLRITSLRGDDVTIDEVAAPSPFASTLSIKARRTATQGLALRSVTLRNNNKSMRLSFAPELDLASNATCSFQIDQNEHNKTLSGSVSVESKGGTVQLRWQPKSPDWAKSRVINGSININAEGYKIEVR